MASSDPFAFPLIDPAYLSSPFDIHVMVEAVKSVRTFLKASPWEGFILEPFGAGATLDITSDSAIEDFVKTFTATEWHPVGTASMSPKGASYGVTNPDLTVKGVTGLRVVDASVIVSYSHSVIRAVTDLLRLSRSPTCPLHTSRLRFTLLPSVLLI